MENEALNILMEQYQELKQLIIAANKDVLNFDELAVYTGYSKSYLYGLTSKRELPFYKPTGGQIFFKKSEIDSWLTRNRQATQAEINSKASAYCLTH